MFLQEDTKLVSDVFSITEHPGDVPTWGVFIGSKLGPLYSLKVLVSVSGGNVEGFLDERE